MNITALRPRFIQALEPLAALFARFRITPNQISLLSLICGIICALLYANRLFLLGSLLLLISAILDLVDGTVARMTETESKFGAVIDWIFDKYVDALALLGIGLSGIPILSALIMIDPQYQQVVDFSIIGLAIMGSMMNTFLKPLYMQRLVTANAWMERYPTLWEGPDSSGRPETIIGPILGGVTGVPLGPGA